MNVNRSERGQALVLIVLAIVGMMAFAALAVDGGMMYAERRRAQNAADAAALAAALAGVQGNTDIVTVAENVLRANGYTPGVDVVVEPAVSGDLYTVVIKMNIKPVFSQFLFSGGLPMEAEAVARGKGGNSNSSNAASQNAIHGLDPDSNSVRFNGGVTVIVNQGNIYAKNILDKDGGNDNGTEKAGIYMNTGNILYSGSMTGSTDGYWRGVPNSPNLQAITPQKVAVQEDPFIPEPACPANAADNTYVDSGSGKNAVRRYYPGTYYSRLDTPNSKVEFTAGLYCFMDGIRINGNSDVYTVAADGTKLMNNQPHTEGVLFVVKGGETRINGNATVWLLRSSNITDANGQQFGGLLFYSSGGDVTMIGGSNSTFEGTIYAPNSTCEFGGNTSVNAGNKKDLQINAQHFNGNVICNYVWIHGNARVKFDYQAAASFNSQSVPIIELVK